MKLLIFVALFFVQNVCAIMVLKDDQYERNKRQAVDLPTFISPSTWESFERNGIPFLQNGANYLFGSESFPNEFDKLLSAVYRKITDDPISIKDKLIQSLSDGEKFSVDNSIRYKKAVSTINDNYRQLGLEKTVVYVYTTYYVYSDLINAMRKQGTNVELTDAEKTLASFALVLNAILFCWKPLQSVSQVTYRGASFTVSDIAKYSVGTEFVWVQFTSSSTNRTVSEDFYMGNVLFIFDNSKITSWRPKDISPYSYDRSHQEALFPSGAMFRVTSKETFVYKGKSSTAIMVQLINRNTSSAEKVLHDKYMLLFACICTTFINFHVLF